MQTYRHYSYSFQKALFYPIKVALFERSMSMPMLVKELNKMPLGINYTLSSLDNCWKGQNNASISLHYYSNIYNILNLPIPTCDYLYKSFLRWEEIKEFKKNRTINNKKKQVKTSTN